MVRNLSDSIYEPSVSSRCWCYCLKVSGWSGTYQIPSMSQHPSVRCANGQQPIRYHPMSQQASMSRPLLQIIADTIREVSLSSRCCCDCLKVSGWSAAYQIPSHEPASIREVCQWSAVYQIASMSRRCGSAGIRELVIWYRWNYEPSVIADYCRYHP